MITIGEDAGLAVYALIALFAWREVSRRLAWAFSDGREQPKPDGLDLVSSLLLGSIGASVWPALALIALVERHAWHERWFARPEPRSQRTAGLEQRIAELENEVLR